MTETRSRGYDAPIRTCCWRKQCEVDWCTGMCGVTAKETLVTRSEGRNGCKVRGGGDLGDAKLKRGDATAGEEAEEAGSNFAARVSIVALIINASENIAMAKTLRWRYTSYG
jgi:hypothetical protein